MNRFVSILETENNIRSDASKQIATPIQPSLMAEITMSSNLIFSEIFFCNLHPMSKVMSVLISLQSPGKIKPNN